jgi:hypothetical protein
LDATYEHRTRPAFSIRHPSACGTPQDASQPGVVDINIVGCQPIHGLTSRQGYTFSFAILSLSASLTDPCSALHAVFKAANVTNVRYMPALNDESWRTCEHEQAANFLKDRLLLPGPPAEALASRRKATECVNNYAAHGLLRLEIGGVLRARCRLSCMATTIVNKTPAPRRPHPRPPR